MDKNDFAVGGVYSENKKIYQPVCFDQPDAYGMRE